jgi:hypothetical protein
VSHSDFTAADFAGYAPEFRRSGVASASRTLGYIGLLAWILPIVGVPLTFIGFALGIASLRGSEPRKALRATLFCTVGLLLSVSNSIAGIYLYTHGKFPTTTAAPTLIVNPHCQSRTSASTNGQ